MACSVYPRRKPVRTGCSRWCAATGGIETRQHYRRDHTQREDHCQVRHSTAARHLSLRRSLAIFLYEHQRGGRTAKRSLPDWQRKNHRHPNPLIHSFTAGVG